MRYKLLLGCAFEEARIGGGKRRNNLGESSPVDALLTDDEHSQMVDRIGKGWLGLEDSILDVGPSKLLTTVKHLHRHATHLQEPLHF